MSTSRNGCKRAYKKDVGSSDESEEKSDEKSDDNGKNDLKNVSNTSKETVSVETVSRPPAQPAMPVPVQGQQSVLGLHSYPNVMPGMQTQMMSPCGMQPLAADGDSSAMMHINVGDFQTLMNFVW